MGPRQHGRVEGRGHVPARGPAGEDAVPWLTLIGRQDARHRACHGPLSGSLGRVPGLGFVGSKWMGFPGAGVLSPGEAATGLL